MKLLFQFLVILLFWGIGEAISYLCQGLVPGSLIGMILLFVALSTNLIKSKWVDSAARYFSKYMVMLFLPSAVGIMVSWSLMGEYIIPIVIIVTLSTALTMLIASWIQQKITKEE